MKSVKVKGKHQEIYQDRGKRYGDHVLGHTDLGLLWTGILQNHYGIRFAHAIPAHLVEVMMVLNKLNRIAVNPSGRDHYDDANVYLAMAEDAANAEGQFKRENGQDSI